MKNTEFLEVIAQSFCKFLTTHSRSNEKLKILHGAIAKDIQNQLGKDYEIKAYDIGDGKEGKIQGRYLNKNVDITILKDDVAVAGIGVKFVMQNYAQNSVNYFENMLGETANIRSNNIPYFQIFIIPDELPYYKSGGKFDHWEQFTQHNVEKYLTLSKDNIEHFFHSPTKTLLFVVNLPKIEKEIANKKDYIDYYLGLDEIEVKLSQNHYGDFQNSVIYNDYKTYINKVVHYIKSI
ncbi:MAG: hypothetical protein KGV44_03540 [Flavobacteriaceae bacterium]|nr:hypothetical protein [Flavobacteriaceae bacterium]